MDVATLGIAIDSQPVTRARDELGRFVSAAKAATTANDNLAGAADRAGDQMAGAAASATAEAAAVSRSVGPLKAAEAAHNQVNRVIRAGNYQRTNLIAQLNDVGVSLASGQALWMVAIQQGSQIATIWGPEEGGVARAFKETGALAAQAAVKLGPLIAVAGAVALGIEAIAVAASKASSGKAVSFGNVLTAMFEMVRDRAGRAAGDILDYFGVSWAGIAKFAKKEFNSVAQGIALTGSDIEHTVDLIVAVWNGGFERVKMVWSQLPSVVGDYAFRAAQTVLNAINGMIDSLNSSSNRGTFGQQMPQMEKIGSMGPNPYAGAADQFASQWGASVATQQKAIAKADADYAARNKAIKGTNYADELVSRSVEIANRPTDKERKAAEKEAERQRKAYEDLTRGAQQYIDQQRLEAQAIGMTEQAAARLRYEQDLLNRAANDNIKLTPEMTANLKGLAAQMAEAETSTSKLREAYDFAKGTFQGFFEDFRSGLANGEGVWDSFASAAGNALNSISSKLLELVTSKAFDALLGLGGSAGGGAAGGGILSAIMSIFGFANGGAFSHGNVIPFARGGVVTRPTVFPMAKGMGLMGEAGPEAVMPLRRTADGRLGVAASGGGTGGGTVVNAITVDLRGTTGDKELDEKLKASATAVYSQTMRDAKRATPGWLAEHQTMRG